MIRKKMINAMLIFFLSNSVVASPILPALKSLISLGGKKGIDHAVKHLASYGEIYGVSKVQASKIIYFSELEKFIKGNIDKEQQKLLLLDLLEYDHYSATLISAKNQGNLSDQFLESLGNKVELMKSPRFNEYEVPALNQKQYLELSKVSGHLSFSYRSKSYLDTSLKNERLLGYIQRYQGYFQIYARLYNSSSDKAFRQEVESRFIFSLVEMSAMENLHEHDLFTVDTNYSWLVYYVQKQKVTLPKDLNLQEDLLIKKRWVKFNLDEENLEENLDDNLLLYSLLTKEKNLLGDNLFSMIFGGRIESYDQFLIALENLKQEQNYVSLHILLNDSDFSNERVDAVIPLKYKWSTQSSQPPSLVPTGIFSLSDSGLASAESVLGTIIKDKILDLAKNEKIFDPNVRSESVRYFTSHYEMICKVLEKSSKYKELSREEVFWLWNSDLDSFQYRFSNTYRYPYFDELEKLKSRRNKFSDFLLTILGFTPKFR